MSADTIAKIAELSKSWSEEDQAELVEYARDIEARRTGVYALSDEERAAVREGLDQADRGEFATDEEVAAMWARFRK